MLVRLGSAGVPDAALAAAAIAGDATNGEREAFWPGPDGLLLIKAVPIFVDRRQPEVLGTLILGFSLDNRQATRFKTLTNSEIAFGVNGQIHASTLPREHLAGARAAARPARHFIQDRSLATRTISRFANPLGPAGAGGQPMALVLRSQTERLRFLTPLHTLLGATAVVAVLVATLLSYAVARTVTRPLGAITATMREMAATGDLTRRIR